MNRFNLTFSGEIVTGQEPETVKLRFAKMFAIDDPVRLERFFSGETVTLRRNLERKEAAQYFQDLRKIGAVSELVKVTASEAANTVVAWPTPPKAENAGAAEKTAAHVETAQDDAEHENGQDGTQQNSDSEQGVRERITAKKAARLQAELEALKRAKVEEAAQLNAERREQLRQVTEEEAQLKAELQQVKRSKEEETARQQAEKEEQKRIEAEEAAQLKAEKEEQKRIKAEEAARLKAEKEEQKRIKAEEATRIKAEKEEQQQREAEEARLKAEKEERQRRKAKKAARIKAKKAARIKAKKEEQQRRAAEEAARIKAEKEEQQRHAAEEAARIKTEKEEQQRREAEEDARGKAEKEEQQRREAEEAARIKAEKEEQQRREAEEAARIEAEKEEQQRHAAEEAARIKAEIEERQRRAAEEAARIKAEKEEQQRREAEEAARLQAELDEIQRQEEEQTAKLQAELAEKQRQVEVEAVRIKADAEYRRAEAQRKSLERRRAPAATVQQQPQEPAPQETTTDHAADMGKAGQEVAGQKTVKPVKARVKTSIDVPQRLSGQTAATAGRRKRQPGEPNLYQLQPFRNTPEVRSRAARAAQRQSQGFTLGALALAVLFILTGAFLRHPPAPALVGASAIALDPQQGPVMLAGDVLLFHDRAGIGTRQVALRELGLDHLQGPMAFDNTGNLIAVGQLTATADSPTPAAAPVLLRCELALSRCLPFSAALANSRVGAFAINSIDNSLLLADTAAGQLLKVDAQGKVLLRKDIAIPARPVLRMNSGLLFMNSALGPAISVFRYDDNAFGQQLDEVLLLPPAAGTLEQTSTGDFIWSAGAWWVNLINPGNGSTGLYRFDMDWNFLTQVELPFDKGMLELDSWAMKTLVNDGRSVAIQRFNAQGAAEAPLLSSMLQKRVDAQQRRAGITALSWLGALLLSAMLTALGLCYGYLQRLRTLVYKTQRERGAQPVDGYEDTLQWIDPVENRNQLLRRRGVSYTLLAAALLLLAIGSSVSAWQLTALLIALSGPAIALLLLSRRPPGNIAHLEQQLLLVDHRGMYHMGEGPQIHYRGSFLMIDDVLVFTGNRLLPAFSPQQIDKAVTPLAAGGVKVDRNTVMVKLLQSRHPLALGALAIMATSTVALFLLGLKGIF